MRRFLVPSACLAVGALACLAASAAAAPAPEAADLDKYLPDDAQMVAVVNVKQITSWTPFQKQFQEQIRQVLKNNSTIAEVLKDTGFDPTRDVDRVVIVAAASSVKVVTPPAATAPAAPSVKFTPPPAGGAAPPPAVSESTASGLAGFTTFLLVQGKFDADKLEAKAVQAARDHAGLIKSRKVGDARLWEIALPAPNLTHIYLSLVDRNTLMATAIESQALEALDKAAGKTKTDLKDKQVREALAKADSRAALRVVASGDVVTSVTMKSDGKGGVTTTTRSLRDQGIEGLRLAVTLGDADLHAELTYSTKDADKAKDMAKAMNDGLEMGIKNVTNAAREMKDFLPLVDALKSVKIAASGATVSAEGRATPEAIPAGLKAWFTVRAPEAAPGARPSVEPRPGPAVIKDK